MLSAAVKADLAAQLPGAMIMDRFGSSEAGAQGAVEVGASGPKFVMSDDTAVLDDDLAAPGTRGRSHRTAGPDRADPRRLLQGRGQDGGHLPDRRRRGPLVGSGGPGLDRPRRRHHRPRAGLGVDQLRVARRSFPRRWRPPSRRTPTCTTPSWSACPTSGSASGWPPSSGCGTAPTTLELDELGRPLPGPRGRLQGSTAAAAGRRDPADCGGQARQRRRPGPVLTDDAGLRAARRVGRTTRIRRGVGTAASATRRRRR